MLLVKKKGAGDKKEWVPRVEKQRNSGRIKIGSWSRQIARGTIVFLFGLSGGGGDCGRVGGCDVVPLDFLSTIR